MALTWCFKGRPLAWVLRPGEIWHFEILAVAQSFVMGC